jgi:hypothetical protein
MKNRTNSLIVLSILFVITSSVLLKTFNAIYKTIPYTHAQTNGAALATLVDNNSSMINNSTTAAASNNEGYKLGNESITLIMRLATWPIHLPLPILLLQATRNFPQ